MRKDTRESPGERERRWKVERQRTVDAWWLAFADTMHYRRMRPKIRHMASFAAYVTRELLFCGFDSPQSCAQITIEHIEQFVFEELPSYVIVDDPESFVAACTEWMLWVCSQPESLIHARAIEKHIKKIRRDALAALTPPQRRAAGAQLVEQALAKGRDISTGKAVYDYLVSTDPSGADYYEEFLLPFPCAFVCSKGQFLYLHDWPPDLLASDGS